MFVGEVYQLMYGQGIMMGWMDFDWNLVSCIIYVVGFYFDQWSDGIESFFEGFQGIGFVVFFYFVQCIVNDMFGNGFFVVFYYVVYEFGQDLVFVFWISQYFMFGCYMMFWY